ncbi:MAG: hypothetical protein N2B00_10335, partial [Vibrio fluvialis]
GWDVIFIVQDISIVDKQARLALAEHTVFCRRLDRMQVPFLSTLVWLLTLGQLRLPMPKLHVGIVKYGDNTNSLTVDKWMLWGTDLYSCYDTKQMFMNNYPHGLYSVLPSWYTHGRYTVTYTPRNLMRITKIYLRKYSRIAMFTMGAVLGAAVWHFSAPDPVQITQIEATPEQPKQNLKQLLDGYRIVSYSALPNSPIQFELSKNGHHLTAYELRSMGFEISSNGRCDIIIQSGEQREKVNC